MDELSLERAAREEPRALALCAGAASYDFASLCALTRALAAVAGLRALDPDALVAVQASNRLGLVALLLALLERRQPFALLHPRLTPTERGSLLARLPGARALLEEELASLEREALAWSGPAPALSAPSKSDEELAALLFTSGTTGTPRGARLSRRAFLASASASARNLGWTSSDRWLLALPLCHVGGLSVLTRCLAARRPLVLQERFDPAAVGDAVRSRGATLVSLVPTMLAACLDGDEGAALSGARAVLCGGAHLSVALRERAARAGVLTLATYGLTEACSQVSTQAPRPSREVALGSGRALQGMELRVEGGAQEGPLEVRGRSLFSGYLGEAPRAPEQWFCTGDWGRLEEDGTLHVLARRTDLVVSGGENVYPAEVEQALEALPGVRAALVFGVRDERWGERVAALLVREEGFALEVAAARLAELLASYKRPRLWAAVESLPLGPTGKPDRAAARARFEDALTTWPARGDSVRG